jgi:hypothetical protein
MQAHIQEKGKAPRRPQRIPPEQAAVPPPARISRLQQQRHPQQGPLLCGGGGTPSEETGGETGEVRFRYAPPTGLLWPQEMGSLGSAAQGAADVLEQQQQVQRIGG